MAASLPDRLAARLLPALLLPAALGAQELARPEMRGRVERQGAGVPGAMVVLHRVTPAEAGPVDSVPTGADGGFVVPLPTVPDPGGRQEVYFASTEHQGVTYFGPAIHLAAQLDSLYRIEVHDTRPAPPGGVALPLAVRYTILEEEEEGWRVTDLLEVRNDGDATLVAAEGGVTWTYPMPAGITEFEMGGRDASPAAGRLEDGVFRVYAAIPPGDRQFVVRYLLPGDDVALRYPGPTANAELLVREPAPPLEVEGLRPLEAVELEPGVDYRRYGAIDLNDATVVVRRGAEPFALPVRWLAVGLTLLLAVAALFFVLRPRPIPAGAGGAPAPAAGPPAATPADRRQALLLEVARLDEARAAGEIPDDDEYARRRRALLERIGSLPL